MTSGGFQPTASQNNPANVSATGGNGQSGNGTQAAKYIPGLPQGQGQATMDTQQAVPMAGDPIEALSQGNNLPPLVGIGEPTTTPERPVTHGMPFGDGSNEPPVLPTQMPQQQEPSAAIIRSLYALDPRNEDLRYLVESLDEMGR